MIWFRDPPAATPLEFGPTLTARGRMKQALERVASRAPQLRGAELVGALLETGLVDPPTVRHLLPEFAGFDPERHFADHLRSLSFRGASRADEFRAAMERVVVDVVGSGARMPAGAEEAIVFEHGERQGVLLAFPEVNFSVGGRSRDWIAAAAEEMPDAIVVVARTFDAHAPGQLAALLSGADVPGTLVSVNLMLGIRAMVQKYAPPPDRVVDLLAAGRLLRSPDVAVLGERFLHA
jgi:hypothetical protein